MESDNNPSAPDVNNTLEPPILDENYVPPGPIVADTGISMSNYALLVAVGAFATTFAQQRVLGKFPTTFLLKEHLHLHQEQVAVFFFWATFAWNLKPIAGILTDAFPLFGTRRRSYMILGAATAGVLWIVMGLFPDSYKMLLIVSILVNIATVFASTVMGGLMVEAGQKYGVSGRITSLRQVVQSVAGIGAPLLGGFLAGKAFGWTVTTSLAAATVFGLAILTFFALREKKSIPPAKSESPALLRARIHVPLGVYIGIVVGILLASALTYNADLRNIGISFFAIISVFLLIIGLTVMPTRNLVIMKAQEQLGQILHSRTLWLAIVMLFLVYTVPGLETALTYRQSDVLHLDKTFIGFLDALVGAAGVVGALAYALFCRKLNLRILIILGVSLNAAVTLLYLIYTRSSAPTIHILAGFSVVLSELALMDLAVRSTPRGCEALGFALMMSIRNFGVALSDVLGTKMIDQYHFTFNSLVWVNAGTTASVLFFVFFLPYAILSRREGDKA